MCVCERDRERERERERESKIERERECVCVEQLVPATARGTVSAHMFRREERKSGCVSVWVFECMSVCESCTEGL